MPEQIINFLTTQIFVIMKKLTFLMAALAISMVTFAQGKITYELNGGVTNDDGWQDKEDMYQGLYESWNTFNGGGQTAWTPLATLIEENGNAENAVPKGIPTQAATMDLPFIQDETVKAKWQWLVDYMDAVCTAQEKTLPSSSGAFLRYNLSAFFFNSVRAGWPASADYSTAGNPESFIPTWKHAFAGPTEYDGTAEVIIPDPYKEGFTFDGWYESADFSGDKIISIPAGATGDKTLYAKWIEYIPTCAEVWALGSENVATKTAGTVTFASGKNVYIQDATAGMYVYFTEAPEVAPGDYIVVSGATDEFNGQFELANAVLESKTAGTLPAPQTVTISGLLASDSAYMYEYVALTGVRVAKYSDNEYHDLYLTDGIDTILVYGVSMDMEAFPVRTRVNANLTVCTYNGTTQLKGYAENITLAPLAGKDPYAYPDKGNYQFENKWLFSRILDNFEANKLGTTDYVRGMAAKDGMMYFVDREHKRLVVVDGTTGEQLDPIVLADNIFTYTQYEGTDTAQVVTAGTLPFNDIKIDGAGNVLLGNCITSNLGRFQVWKIDLATGEGTLVIDEVLADNPDYAEANLRFDAFGVYGDVDNDAVIMAANANAFEAYSWTITGGKAEKGVLIELAVDEDEFIQALNLTNPGSAPQIFPVDETFFYLDGNATYPTLFDTDGNWVDGFQTNQSLLKPYMVIGTDTAKCTLNEGHNGLCEFQVGNDYFVVMAATNTVGSPASAFVLYKYAGADKVMADMEPMWFFPEAGMGGSTNAYRTAVPSVEVDGNVATIYVYAGENGYGVYTMTAQQTALSENRIFGLSISPEGLLSETVAEIQVYAVSGQCVFAARNVNAVSVAVPGVYVVKAVRQNGENVIKKYIAK